MLETVQACDLFSKCKLSERVSSEHVLQLTATRVLQLCSLHSHNLKFVKRIISKIFFNNAQKLAASNVYKDAVLQFKQRQRKRKRLE